MRILIVDDNRTFCQFLVELLEMHGYETEWTTHGLQAYKMSMGRHYDLLVADVRMTPLLGTELAEGLRQIDPGMSIILISAFADEALQNAAQKLGVPLLSKPFTAETFLNLVARTVQG